MTGKHPAVRLLLALLIACAATFTSSCRPRTTAPHVEFTLQKVAFQLGDTKIHAHVTQVGESALTMVHLHEDEKTSAEAGRAVLEKHGGRLIQLVHSGRRRVSFSLDGASYSFDPNRIFSEAGVEKTLRGRAPIPARAYAVVNEFAAQFVHYFALKKQRSLLALHNNGEDYLSIHSYAPGAENGADAEKLFVNPDADPDNFYYVTEARFFHLLSARNFNVLLQNNRTVTDDGSLSVFAGRYHIPYINVEAQNGQIGEQIRMLEAAVQISGANLTSQGGRNHEKPTGAQERGWNALMRGVRLVLEREVSSTGQFLSAADPFPSITVRSGSTSEEKSLFTGRSAPVSASESLIIGKFAPVLACGGSIYTQPFS